MQSHSLYKVAFHKFVHSDPPKRTGSGQLNGKVQGVRVHFLLPQLFFQVDPIFFLGPSLIINCLKCFRPTDRQQGIAKKELFGMFVGPFPF